MSGPPGLGRRNTYRSPTTRQRDAIRAADFHDKRRYYKEPVTQSLVGEESFTSAGPRALVEDVCPLGGGAAAAATAVLLPIAFQSMVLVAPIEAHVLWKPRGSEH